MSTPQAGPDEVIPRAWRPAVTRRYLVHMPAAEARHLAGTGPAWPATAEARVLTGVREWLAGISRRRTAVITVRKVVTDLTLILEAAPLPCRPLPGQVDYLGGGIVRLDDAAITALAGLPPGEDFRVILWNLAYHYCPFSPGDGWMITNERPTGLASKQQRGGAGQMKTACMSALRSSRSRSTTRRL